MVDQVVLVLLQIEIRVLLKPFCLLILGLDKHAVVAASIRFSPLNCKTVTLSLHLIEEIVKTHAHLMVTSAFI